jgi:hypothetical protein
VDGGQETDPNKVKAGDMYMAQLGQFFAERNHVPTIISVGEARRLCAVFEMQVGRNMVIWHVRQEPVKSSGNPMFDDSARTMLLKLLDDKTPLPTPPKEFDEQIRSRKVQLTILGDPHGDPTRCRKMSTWNRNSPKPANTPPGIWTLSGYCWVCTYQWACCPWRRSKRLSN